MEVLLCPVCSAKHSCIVLGKVFEYSSAEAKFFKDMGIGVHSCTCVAKYSCLVKAKYSCLVLAKYSCRILAKLHRDGTLACTVTVP